MTLDRLAEAARSHHLAILGLCHTEDKDAIGSGTLALLGPGEPGFWAHVTTEHEFADLDPNPMDRWSHRVISDVAQAVSGAPLFPFGLPVRPFITWAIRSGRCHVSPVGLLVHDTAGLLVSFRGAVLLPERLALPKSPANPCLACEAKPCLSACPVNALTGDGYDLPACHSYLDLPEGAACMNSGCAVRRTCPVSQAYPRDAGQSAFHMASFHPGRRA